MRLNRMEKSHIRLEKLSLNLKKNIILNIRVVRSGLHYVYLRNYVHCQFIETEILMIIQIFLKESANKRVLWLSACVSKFSLFLTFENCLTAILSK